MSAAIETPPLMSPWIMPKSMEIIDEEKKFVILLEAKMKIQATSQDKSSIEEIWLSLISDFRTPDQPFKREQSGDCVISIRGATVSVSHYLPTW